MKRSLQVLLLAALGFLGSRLCWADAGAAVGTGTGVALALGGGGAAAVGSAVGVALSSGGCDCDDDESSGAAAVGTGVALALGGGGGAAVGTGTGVALAVLSQHLAPELARFRGHQPPSGAAPAHAGRAQRGPSDKRRRLLRGQSAPAPG